MATIYRLVIISDILLIISLCYFIVLNQLFVVLFDCVPPGPVPVSTSIDLNKLFSFFVAQFLDLSLRNW